MVSTAELALRVVCVSALLFLAGEHWGGTAFAAGVHSALHYILTAWCTCLILSVAIWWQQREESNEQQQHKHTTGTSRRRRRGTRRRRSHVDVPLGDANTPPRRRRHEYDALPVTPLEGGANGDKYYYEDDDDVRDVATTTMNDDRGVSSSLYQ